MNQHECLNSIRDLYEEQKQLCIRMRTALKAAPEGRLSVRIRSGEPYYSCVIKRGQKRESIHIPTQMPKMQELVVELANKSVMRRAVPLLENNLRAMERLINAYRVYDPEKMPQIQYCDESVYTDGDNRSFGWDQSPYERNPYDRKSLIFETKKGDLVRSKSEVLIADALFDAGVQYRYEAVIKGQGWQHYPDYTILHPATREIVLWEHLGRMDDEKYVRKQFYKLIHYAETGFTLNNNLIMTLESGRHPLTPGVVKDAMTESGLI